MVKNDTLGTINKTAIKNFAVYSRNKLIQDIKNKAALIGITESDIKEPLSSSTGNIQLFDIGMQEPYRIEGKAIDQRNALIQELKSREKDSAYEIAYETLIEEVAYTWFNRIIAIRFMEVNNYMPDRMRVLSSGVEGINEPEFLTHVFETKFEFSKEEKNRIIELKTDGSNLAMDELFQFLFIKQCNALNTNLPELFEKTNDYTELLLTVSYNDVDGVISKLVQEVPEEDFDVTSLNGHGQVEIIGWFYQYYNTDPKSIVDKAVKSKKKVNKFQLPAKTQLFTPDWIVKYMVENSLGRLWIEKLHSSGDKRSEEEIASQFGWQYYLPEAEQVEDVGIYLGKIRKERSTLSVEDITFIDPAMGSFHIGIYAFEVFMQIYESEGYTTSEAVKLVVEKNLHGLEIDKRATQLSYFACMMKARKYNRKILDGSLHPRVYEIIESNDINLDHLDYMGNNVVQGESWKRQKKQLIALVDSFHDAKEYGSLTELKSEYNLDQLKNFVLSIRYDNQISLFNTLGLEETQKNIIKLINVAQLLLKEYDVVVANPPYMGSSVMNSKLVEFGKKYYPNSKSDLFAMFIEWGNKRVKNNGCNAMVTMQSWMYLSSYKDMRENVLEKYSISNLMHMENMVMGIAFGTAVTLFWNRTCDKYKGTYHYVKYKQIKNDQPFVFPDKDYRYSEIDQNQFKKIPGYLIAYSANDKFMPILQSKNRLKKWIDLTGSQHITANNDRFLRMFWEVDINEVGKNWITYAKGGAFRKWWGNLQLVVDWSEEAQKYYKNNKTSNMLKDEYRFRKGITWTATTNNMFSARVLPDSGLFDKKGPALFVEDDLEFYLGILNSSSIYYILKMLKSGSDYQNIEIKNIPLATFTEDKKRAIKKLSSEAISISREDWNTLETSLEFDSIIYKPEHSNALLEDVLYKIQEMQLERFNRLKNIEEEINLYTISAYGLEDEISPCVEDKSISTNLFNNEEIVKKFLSYVVGCILGRYCSEEIGVTFAGGIWDLEKYSGFIPNSENIILFTDQEYHSNDIIKGLEDFLEKVYGKSSLEINLRFIGNSLKSNGDTPREVIRNYFLNDFYDDHLKMFQKRPIYWLLESGKNNGFKALIYMHRYNEDTLGKVRVNYLHEIQKVYERTILNLQDNISHSKDARESSQIQKNIEKIMKQLKECKDYDVLIGHMALERVEIDLDDGVKFNHLKVQTDSKQKIHQILASI